MSIRLFAEVFISLGLFSLVSSTIKWISADPFVIGIVRLLIAASGMFIFVRLKYTWAEFTYYSRKEWRGLSYIGIFFFLHWLTYFFSIKLSTASLGILSLSTYGVLLGIMGAYFRREPYGVKDLLSAVVCLLGVYLLIPEFNFKNTYTLGVMIGLSSAVFFSLVPLVHKRINHVPARIRIFYQFFGALICFLFTAPWANWNITVADWWGLIFLGLGATLIAHALWSHISSRLHGKTAGLIYYSYIPFSVLFAHLLLGDQLGSRNLFGGGLIILGLLLGTLMPTKAAKKTYES
jgi:drug/metabolite transporter (DMT)-like permease